MIVIVQNELLAQLPSPFSFFHFLPPTSAQCQILLAQIHRQICPGSLGGIANAHQHLLMHQSSWFLLHVQDGVSFVVLISAHVRKAEHRYDLVAESINISQLA